MAHINHLPVEILDLVMSYLFATATRKRCPTPSRAMFPFNVASVCSLWLNVLKSRPRYWQCIAIDVADDPTPFLGVISHFSDSAMEQDILVFSSLKDGRGAGQTARGYSEDRLKWRENFRTHAIFAYLEPALSRFAHITFDLVYQSSLPSATRILCASRPRLVSLTLSCEKYDADDDESEIKVDVDKLLSFSPDAVFPHLETLNLTGLALMELYQLGPGWVYTFKDQFFRLSVTHFKFHKPGWGAHNGSRDLDNLMDMICESVSNLDAVCLSDLSLSYYPMLPYQGEHCVISTDRFVCDGVSHEFLLALFSCLRFDDGACNTDVVFRGCAIPHNAFEMQISPRCLALEDIPAGAPPAPGAGAPQIRHPNTREASLFNALTGIHPGQLRFARCAGLTDEVLEWLADKPGACVIRDLEELAIRNCAAFSARGLHALVAARAALCAEYGGQAVLPLAVVQVTGARGPVLAEVDRERLLGRQIGETRIVWDVDEVDDSDCASDSDEADDDA